MNLTLEEIRKIAKLARISLNEGEERKMAQQLSAVIDYFKKLQTVDTSGVDVHLSEGEEGNRLREDEARESGNQEVILSQAPLLEDNFIKVKSVL